MVLVGLFFLLLISTNISIADIVPRCHFFVILEFM